jgi:hypothetical protein
MALPMDEQRILEEMERMLAADDPRLAARLAAFGRPGFSEMLRTRRARAAIALMALAVIAAVAIVMYMMSTVRLGIGTGPGQRPVHHANGLAGRGTAPPTSARAAPPGAGSQSGLAVARAACLHSAARPACMNWSVVRLT